MSTPMLKLDDIQGNLLWGYHMERARHFPLRVDNAGGARALIAEMVSGNAERVPQITTSVPWPERRHPPFAVNLGLTCAGLAALGLSQDLLALFPAAFREGPTDPQRAEKMGDTGPNAPQGWALGGPRNGVVHLLVSVHSDQLHEIERATLLLRARFHHHGVSQLDCIEATGLPDEKGRPGARVHFGYRDGIAQPRIDGAPELPGKPVRPDAQPLAPAGDFLLGGGYENSFGGNHLGDLPAALGTNATYGAFRLLGQDAAAFERFIHAFKPRWDMDAEMVAAKLMGRWRNGVPLSLSPDRQFKPGTTQPAVAERQWNDFDYAPSEERSDRYDDRIGLRCPIGSHIRRLNPRSALVMGKPHSRRIVRRALPYGVEYRGQGADAVDDGVPRGLVGYFLCADLEMQYEFIQRVWANSDIAAAGLRGTLEPILGTHPDCGGKFVIRMDDLRDPIVIDDLPRLVTTHGGLYCFLPGIGGLKFLSRLGEA